MSVTLNTQQPTNLWIDMLRRMARHPTGMVGVAIVALLLLMGIVGPALAPYDPNEMDFGVRFVPPNVAHPMGADDFGRDILSRLMVGARVSLQVALIAVGIATVAGTLLGMLAGYSNRVVDEIIMRSMDVLFAFPAMLLAIAILAALGKGVANAMIAIGIVYTPIFARIARSAVILGAGRRVCGGGIGHRCQPWSHPLSPYLS